MRSSTELGPRGLVVAVILQAIIDAEAFARGAVRGNDNSGFRHVKREELVEFFSGDAIPTLLNAAHIGTPAAVIQRTGLEILSSN